MKRRFSGRTYFSFIPTETNSKPSADHDPLELLGTPHLLNPDTLTPDTNQNSSVSQMNFLLTILTLLFVSVILLFGLWLVKLEWQSLEARRYYQPTPSPGSKSSPPITPPLFFGNGNYARPRSWI